jgi:hypothetical protein
MNTFSELLQVSQRQYAELINITREIGEQINRLDSETIRVFQKELSALLDEAQATDQQINELSFSNLNGVSNPLFQERAEIMRSFLELNRSVASKLIDKQAVIRAEYLKIRKGRNGISGYQSSLKKQYQIVNDSI